MKIIRKEEQKTSLWSGGKTTELYIYPPESNYSERNFEVRISTATVETERSVFTPLPGYKRQLMILEGKLSIQHNQEKKMLLLPFQKHEFMGNWETKAEGKVVDFNLMLSEHTDGNMTVVDLTENETKHIQMTTDFFNALYLVNGEAIVNGKLINKNDFLFISEKSKDTFQIQAIIPSKIVLVGVSIISRPIYILNN